MLISGKYVCVERLLTHIHDDIKMRKWTQEIINCVLIIKNIKKQDHLNLGVHLKLLLLNRTGEEVVTGGKIGYGGAAGDCVLMGKSEYKSEYLH